jgi:hypothetical protein
MRLAGGARATALPGLQDVRGQWKGSWEAYGGGVGATSVEFGVRGEDWEWGDYGLDKVPPCGCCPLNECTMREGSGVQDMYSAPC